jgi:putative hydrolase of the HAD superfamily
MSGVPLKAVTFDVGGTLIEPWPSVGHVYAEVARRYGVRNISAELLESRFKAAWRARSSFSETRAGWEELVDEAFQGLATVPPSRSFFPELYERFAHPGAWHLFEDVRPAFDTLAGLGFRLGVISNWDERLRQLLGRLELDSYFEVIVVSCEVGSAKPARAIFEHAAHSLHLPPAAIMHVGDSLVMDVQGARAAGFQALQIHRDTGQPAADNAIRKLSDLLQTVGKPGDETR